MLEPMPFSTAAYPVSAHSIASPTPGSAIDNPAAAWTLDALQTVWEHQRDRVGERIDSIERAIAALSEDRLDAELRHEAERAAHMLAGSVGMFGFLDASDAARNLESELDRPTPERVPVLRALVLRVRDGVRGPVIFYVQDRIELSPRSHSRRRRSGAATPAA
jgi:chemotaxis protein histidine kinase CheA